MTGDRESPIVCRRFATSHSDASWPSLPPSPRLPRPPPALGRRASSRRPSTWPPTTTCEEGDGHLFVTGRAGTGKSTLLTLPQGPDRRRDGGAGADRARRRQRRRPDHPFLLRLPAAPDPARRHPPQPQRPPDAAPEVPRHRRGVDGALRPDVGHRPVAARQPRPPARGLRRRAPGPVRRPASAAARGQRGGGGRAPGVGLRRPVLLLASPRCARAPARR